VITVFYARYQYVNPGFPKLLQRFREISDQRFGTVDVTATSPGDLARAIARSTVVAIDQSLVNAAVWPTPNDSPAYFIHDLRPREHYEDALEQLLQAPAARAIFSYSDLHDKREAAVQRRMAGRINAFFWCFESHGGYRPPPEYHEPLVINYEDPARRWEEVVSLFPVRVETLFGIADDELTPKSPGSWWQASVPGAHYSTRKLAAESIRSQGLSMAPFQLSGKVVRGLNKLVRPVLPRRTASTAFIESQRAMQRFIVERSAATFVCGSWMAYPVRKYFEVPAARSAMVAYPCQGFSDFGFKDGVNTLITMPEDAGKSVRRLLADDRLRAGIIEEAFDLMRGTHSIRNRAIEMRACLERLEAGKLQGARYVEGRFEIF
jgi:hypothetical protein